MGMVLALLPAWPGHVGSQARRGLSGWIPWWSKQHGVDSALAHIERFDSLSPFAFRVKKDGTLHNRLGWPAPHWKKLEAATKRAQVALLPSVVWNDSDAMQRVLSDEKTRASHVRALVARARPFDGLDLDYEGMKLSTRDGFSALLRELAQSLHAQGKRLSCTIEPRTSATIPDNWRTRNSPWAQDHEVIGSECDVVRTMAYDQWRTTLGRRFEGRTTRPQVSHASLQWVDDVVAHTLENVSAHKLWLGVATYGWQFSVTGSAGAWRYERKRAVSFDQLRQLGVPRKERSAGAERLLDQQGVDGRSLVVMPDARSIAARAALARRRGLAGVVLFKLDGRGDPALWQALPGGR